MRARNIKPSTFTNELLAFAAPIHTVIFAGLWCIADRRGVLEDRPQRIHTLINPGRTIGSTRKSLSWLEEHGFIKRYKVENLHLIKVLKFTKHQNPHKDEKPSELPDHGASTVPAPGHNGASTVPAPGKPEPTALIPSSLIPDSSLRDKSPKPPLEKGASRQRRSPHRAERDKALAAWSTVVATEGAVDDPKVRQALKAIGGYSRVRLRTVHEEPEIRREFVEAYVSAAA